MDKENVSQPEKENQITMPTKKQLSESMESQFEFPQTRREDDPAYIKPAAPTHSGEQPEGEEWKKHCDWFDKDADGLKAEIFKDGFENGWNAASQPPSHQSEGKESELRKALEEISKLIINGTDEKISASRLVTKVDLIVTRALSQPPSSIKAEQQDEKEIEAITFLDSIRDYERENGDHICYDERTSKELYDIFKLNNL